MKITNRMIAERAKRDGFEYVATIVKQVFNTKYYNVTGVDYMLVNGCVRRCPNNGNFPVGTIKSQLPEKTVERAVLRRELEIELADR